MVLLRRSSSAKSTKKNNQFNESVFKGITETDFPNAFLMRYVNEGLGERSSLAKYPIKDIVTTSYLALSVIDSNNVDAFNKKYSSLIQDHYAPEILARQKQRVSFCKNLKADLKLAMKASGVKFDRTVIKLIKEQLKSIQKQENEKYRRWKKDPTEIVNDYVKVAYLARDMVVELKSQSAVSGVPPPNEAQPELPPPPNYPAPPNYAAPMPADEIPPAPDYPAPRPKREIPPAPDYPAPRPEQEVLSTDSELEMKFDRVQKSREERPKQVKDDQPSNYAPVEEGLVPNELQDNNLTATRQISSVLNEFISKHKVMKGDKFSEHEKKQWEIAKDLLKDKLEKKQSKDPAFQMDKATFKIGRNKNADLTNSFIFIQGKLYCLKEHMVLGKGSFSKVKMLEDEHGQLFAVKVVKSKQNLQPEISVGAKLDRNVGYFQRKRKAYERKKVKRDEAEKALKEAEQQLNSPYSHDIDKLEHQVKDKKKELQLAEDALQDASEVKQYIIQPYLGMSIESILTASKTPPSQDFMQHLAGIAIEAVMKIHEQNIIHRDLHAGNVLIGPKDGKPDGEMISSISDFGLSEVLASGQEQSHLRTEHFNALMCPPEYMKVKYEADTNGNMVRVSRIPDAGCTYSKSSDVYQLGMMLKYQFDLSSDIIERMVSPDPQNRPHLKEVMQEIANMKFGGYVIPHFGDIENKLIQEARAKIATSEPAIQPTINQAAGPPYSNDLIASPYSNDNDSELATPPSPSQAAVPPYTNDNNSELANPPLPNQPAAPTSTNDNVSIAPTFEQAMQNLRDVLLSMGIPAQIPSQPPGDSYDVCVDARQLHQETIQTLLESVTPSVFRNGWVHLNINPQNQALFSDPDLKDKFPPFFEQKFRTILHQKHLSQPTPHVDIQAGVKLQAALKSLGLSVPILPPSAPGGPYDVCVDARQLQPEVVQTLLELKPSAFRNGWVHLNINHQNQGMILSDPGFESRFPASFDQSVRGKIQQNFAANNLQNVLQGMFPASSVQTIQPQPGGPLEVCIDIKKLEPDVVNSLLQAQMLNPSVSPDGVLHFKLDSKNLALMSASNLTTDFPLFIHSHYQAIVQQKQQAQSSVAPSPPPPPPPPPLFNQRKAFLKKIVPSGSPRQEIKATHLENSKPVLTQRLPGKFDESKMVVQSSGREVTLIDHHQYFQFRKAMLEKKIQPGYYENAPDGTPLKNPILIGKNGELIAKSSSQIGKGSDGVEVFLGMDIDTGKFVAIKSLPMASDSKYIQPEIQTMEGLNRLAAQIEHQGKTYLVDELGWGKDYKAVNEEIAKPPEQRAFKIDANETVYKLDMAIKLFEEIENLHARGYIHCDIKLENVIWDDKEKKAKLIDFGLTRKKEDLADPSKLADEGTAIYKAPEVALSEYTEKSDVYACGVVLMELFSKEDIFREPCIAKWHTSFITGIGISEVLHEMAQDLFLSNDPHLHKIASLVDKMVSASQGDRPPLSEVIKILKEYKNSLTQEIKQEASPAQQTAKSSVPELLEVNQQDRGARRRLVAAQSTESENRPLIFTDISDQLKRQQQVPAPDPAPDPAPASNNPRHSTGMKR